ncbi:meprin A subunit beta-like isoform X1 [Hippoglossus hippoglossus]|uniref:meprin A subunit beta-like isoform X1 n=1 Tax=Hippoglossus hippoglossus TaxID=8267 RepID=UPI00148CBF55|nr:meprin A subunit beta-like isoform X1 [Hippoglossus hippoglossus]
MKVFLFLVVGLAVSSADTDEVEIIDAEEIGQPKDITEINIESNLRDDILKAPNRQSSSISDDDYLWTSPVPYVLENNLEINAKGVILRALDEYRLKSCIDFRPRKNEYYYISVQKLNGCYSYVGRIFSGQEISIGRFCDSIGTVQHEFLHALSFYHEQSRYDRDDHVNILFENIQAGYENNFIKFNKSETTVSGLPYDYNSLMHYSSQAFSNGNGSTIVTKDPKFQDVIGQRQQLSPIDVMELNRRYKCKSTIAFHMYCSFSNESMCGMNNCSNSGNDNGWEMVKQAQGGPKTDHTTLPTASSENGKEEGYFMHASTASGEEGKTSWLETKIMEPTRKCNVQCLQFYYYHSGNESDILNIWIREFDDQYDSEGTRRLMGQITGPQTSHWRIHHVSLNATKHFQVAFEARTGAGSSSGGFSIDDINLSEIECPHGTMQIDNYKDNFNSSSRIYSPRQYTIDGYAYRIQVDINRFYTSVFMQMLSGQNDEKLEWPCLQRQMTLRMLDQTNLQLHMSSEKSFTTSRDYLNSLGISPWDNPRKNGTAVIDENNQTAFAGSLYGFRFFSNNYLIRSRNYIKGDSLILTFNLQDLNPLIHKSALPCPELAPVKIAHPPVDLDSGPCVPRITPPRPKTTPPRPTPPRTRPPRTTPPKTTDDKSIFGFSPAMVASPVLTLLLALMLSMP